MTDLSRYVRTAGQFTGVAAMLMMIGAAGCARDARATAEAKPPGEIPPVLEPAPEEFDATLERFAKLDETGWNAETCAEVASAFENIAERHLAAKKRALPEAHYNAGLALQRCGIHERARDQFERARKARKSFFRATAQLVLYQHRAGKALDETIAELGRIVRDAEFQNVEALVNLAALQMQRAGNQNDGDGTDDFERAKKNIQRALAIDDGYMPALNQLAIYYLELARSRATTVAGKAKGKHRPLVVAGSKLAEANRQQLDLAALVAEQAIRKNPHYAPIFNTAGLVFVELGNMSAAAKSFKRARELDREFYEAHMNYAAVNLSFRGFDEAEHAYRDALDLRPKDYEAHLGLALALRGQVGLASNDRRIDDAERHLEAARKIAPDRAESYYNRAILYQAFRSKSSEDTIAGQNLEKASKLYAEFIERASKDPAYAEAVERARERREDIEATLEFRAGNVAE